MAKKKTKAPAQRQQAKPPTRRPAPSTNSRSNRRVSNVTARGIGSSIGGMLGQAAGRFASTFLGMGDYEVKGNSLLSGGVPFMHTSDTSIRMTHKEFISDISSSVIFTNERILDVNPSNPACFPYLSGIAQNFERYQIHGMIVYFRSTSADALNSTNTALGTVIIASDYDVLDVDWGDKQSMEAAMFSISGKPSCDLVHPIECAATNRFNKQLFLRPGNNPLPQGADAKLYDWCKTTIATTGSQAVATIGELWVSYDIELFVPQLSVPKNMNGKYYHMWSGDYTNAAPLGSTREEFYDTIGVSTSSTVITIQENTYGYFLVTHRWQGTSVTATTPTFVLSNCAANLTWANHSVSDLTPHTVTGTICYLSYMIAITDPTQQATITLSAATLPSSGISHDLVITQVSGSLSLLTF